MSSGANARVLVEVAVDSVTGAKAAAAAGADRIELCSDLDAGGLTPSPGLYYAVRHAVKLPVFVMIRPRPGDFLYDPGEIKAMLTDVVHFCAAGADGIVTGALRADGALDEDALRSLIIHAEPTPITCHRAFDVCNDAVRAIDTLIQLGAARVLTSGQAVNALAGASLIRDCVQRAAGRLTVVAGGGVRDHNVRDVVAATGVREVHLAAAVRRASAMTFRRDGVPIASIPPAGEDSRRFTDGDMVARVVAAVATTPARST